MDIDEIVTAEIVEMAHKAITTEMCEGDDMRAFLRAALLAAAPALIAAERERCAKIADETFPAALTAAAIRARMTKDTADVDTP